MSMKKHHLLFSVSLFLLVLTSIALVWVVVERNVLEQERYRTVRTPRLDGGEIRLFAPSWTKGTERSRSSIAIDNNDFCILKIEIEDGLVITLWGDFIKNDSNFNVNCTYVSAGSVEIFMSTGIDLTDLSGVIRDNKLYWKGQLSKYSINGWDREVIPDMR